MSEINWIEETIDGRPHHIAIFGVQHRALGADIMEVNEHDFRVALFGRPIPGATFDNLPDAKAHAIDRARKIIGDAWRALSW